MSLTVSNLEASLAFYREYLGLEGVGETSGGGVVLGAGGRPLVILYEQRGARPKPYRTRGLYHYALRVPQRRDLARLFVRLTHRWDVDGASDHLVSEAIYLRDPDGHGIELYADRPSREWRYREGRELEMATLPLDIDSLLNELRGEETRRALEDGWRMPGEVRMGHIHLQVSRLERVEKWYHEILGFDITMRGYPGALFLSAGKYHHHIGANVWAGIDLPPPPPESVRLRSFSIELPSLEQLEALRSRLVAHDITVEDQLVNELRGYRGITTQDLDGNTIEITARLAPDTLEP